MTRYRILPDGRRRLLPNGAVRTVGQDGPYGSALFPIDMSMDVSMDPVQLIQIVEVPLDVAPMDMVMTFESDLSYEPTGFPESMDMELTFEVSLTLTVPLILEEMSSDLLMSDVDGLYGTGDISLMEMTLDLIMDPLDGIYNSEGLPIPEIESMDMELSAEPLDLTYLSLVSLAPEPMTLVTAMDSVKIAYLRYVSIEPGLFTVDTVMSPVNLRSVALVPLKPATFTLETTFSVGARTGGYEKFSKVWEEAYHSKQLLLTEIDAKIRELAGEALDEARAVATAVESLTTRVEEGEDFAEAEAQKLTTLTSQVRTAEGNISGLSSAQSLLSTRVTNQGNDISALSQSVTTVTASVNQKIRTYMQQSAPTSTTQNPLVVGDLWINTTAGMNNELRRWSGSAWVTTVDPRILATATATQQLTAEVNSLGQAKATWGVYLTAGNLISGLQSINNGTISEFNVLSHVFRLLSPGAQNGMEVQDGYLRVWRSATQVIIGNGFGASGDLMFYAGPNVGVGNASKQNGTIWFDSAGNSYFGGTLSAGILKNAAQSTQVSTGAQVETGQFGTNGNPKVVVASFSYSQAGFVDSDPGTQALTATVVLERQIGGGSWSEIGRINATGQMGGAGYEPGMGWSAYWQLGGSITVTDNNTSTQNFNYRLRIISASGPWPWILGQGNPGIQRLSIISTEQ